MGNVLASIAGCEDGEDGWGLWRNTVRIDPLVMGCRGGAIPPREGNEEKGGTTGNRKDTGGSRAATIGKTSPAKFFHSLLLFKKLFSF